MQERMNADDPRPDHCGPSCRSWDAAEGRCAMLNEREQRENRHGNVGFFPDQPSRLQFFRGHPCQPYQTLLRRLLATPLLRRPSPHETRDAAHQVLHAGIGRWLEGRAPLRVQQRGRGAELRETVWRHDAVLLSSRWPYYYLFRDELRRVMDDRRKAQLSAGSQGDEPDAPASRDAAMLPSPDAGPAELYEGREEEEASAGALAALHARVARIDPIGAAMLADPDYPELDTRKHAAALQAEYARQDRLAGARGAARKATPTDLTHRRHLAELRAAVIAENLLERLASRHRGKTVRDALRSEERRTEVLSRLLQGYLRAYDREGLFDSFELQRSLHRAPAAFRLEAARVARLGAEAADRLEAGPGDPEALRVRGKKLRTSARKLLRFAERVAELLESPLGERDAGLALAALEAHAFRPFEPSGPGPFTKLGLPASGGEPEREGLVTAACLCVLSGLLGLPRRTLQPRNAVRLLNVLLRDFAVGLGPGDDDAEGETP